MLHLLAQFGFIYALIFAIGGYVWLLKNVDHCYTLPIAAVVFIAAYLRSIQIGAYMDTRRKNIDPEAGCPTECIGVIGMIACTIAGIIISIIGVVAFIEGSMSDEPFNAILFFTHVCAFGSPAMLFTSIPKRGVVRRGGPDVLAPIINKDD